MTTELTYDQLLASRGVSLQQLGLADRALRHADALIAVEIVRQLRLPILGGDVYLVCDQRVELAYANWSCNPRDGEDGAYYVTRSCDEARRYIAAFPRQDDAEPIFVLVIYRR
jgi:hypothetical protein